MKAIIGKKVGMTQIKKKKGFWNVKKLLKDVMINNRDKIINGIRLTILTDQYC